MNWETLGYIGSFTQGIAGILALLGIFAVWIQIKRMTEQNTIAATTTIVTIYQDITQSAIKLDMHLVEYPHLRQYIYENAKIKKDDKDYQRVMSLAEAYLDFMDLHIVLYKASSKQIDCSDIPWAEWRGYFYDIYHRSPAIRQFLKNHDKWYSQTLHDILTSKERPRPEAVI